MPEYNKAFGSCMGPLDFPMQDNEARDLEKLLDTGEYKAFKAQVTRDNFEYHIEKERCDVSTITTPSIDLEGEVVDPDTVSFKAFVKNPVVAFNHRYDIEPVGKSLWQKQVKNAWKAKTYYSKKPSNVDSEQPWLADSIWKLVQAGELRGKSIGGIKKLRQPTEEDAAKFNFDLASCKAITDKFIVYEYSVTQIGMNLDAVVEAVSKKSVTLSDEILATEFPEVWNALKSAVPDDELKTTFAMTADEFLSKKKVVFAKMKKEFNAKVPEIIQETIARQLGRVEI